jgi:hypothetical protein
MIQGALVTILEGDATINGLVSGRIYPVHAIQKDVSYPFITLSTVSAQRELVHSGSSGVVERLTQISCWGNSPAQAYTLAKAVIAKMHGLKQTVSSDKILLSSIRNEVEFYDEDAQTYHVALDVMIYHNE